MELFTSNESLTLSHVLLHEAIDHVQRVVLKCEIAALSARIESHETRLAMIRCQQTQTQQSQSLNHRS